MPGERCTTGLVRRAMRVGGCHLSSRPGQIWPRRCRRGRVPRTCRPRPKARTYSSSNRLRPRANSANRPRPIEGEATFRGIRGGQAPPGFSLLQASGEPEPQVMSPSVGAPQPRQPPVRPLRAPQPPLTGAGDCGAGALRRGDSGAYAFQRPRAACPPSSEAGLSQLQECWEGCDGEHPHLTASRARRPARRG